MTIAAPSHGLAVVVSPDTGPLLRVGPDSVRIAAHYTGSKGIKAIIPQAMPGLQGGNHMPMIRRHQEWKAVSRRADDLANTIADLQQAGAEVPQPMRDELRRLEEEAAIKFRELAGLEPPRRPRPRPRARA